MSKNLSRRDFLKGFTASAVGLAATSVLGGCATTVPNTECPDVTAPTQQNTVTSWLGSEPTIAESEITETWTTDLLIVGAGNGGMMAAVKATDLGLDFRIIEQSIVVGDTRHWYGAVNSADAVAAGCITDKDALLAELSRYASGKADQRVLKTWIDESAAMHDYVKPILENAGLTCTFTSDGAWPGNNGTTYMFPLIEHTYSRDAEVFERNKIFENYINERGKYVDYSTSLVKLEKDGNRVSGVIAQNEDGNYIRIVANKGVILATGGYPGNPEMMEQLDPLGTKVTTACSYSPLNKGYGIKAAVWAGANLDEEPAPMLFDRGVVPPGVNGGYVTDANGNKSFPGPIRQYNPGTQPFMKVNRDGKRFANESCPYNDILYAAANQKGHVYCQVMDSNYWEDVQRFHTTGCSAQTRSSLTYFEGKIAEAIEKGCMMKADTLDELADKLGFKDQAKVEFLAQAERYNTYYDNQKDEEFGKPAYRLSQLRQAPFYGVWLGASLLTTEQGVSINENMQVLSTENEPIEGLYATGDCSGSFFANNYPELIVGVAMGRTLTFALRAVRQIAGIKD